MTPTQPTVTVRALSTEGFITRLRDFVKQRGTQKQAAEELGISTAYLNDVLCGRRDPGRKIAKALGLRKVVAWIAEENNADWRHL